ncbi:hypothetical protein STIAU_7437 [Stigmatella aurantiaca DW4/3-1]|uniref:Uncharacterized protein n=1 Tax=Stigmatella aurantiaca (strain DW4/3-1) TaxID=378806 RepID=Q08S32_STIAD|nr:hypothetical protein STIAU_7437 [Stigmatella aurantiaca DW4/3-1]
MLLLLLGTTHALARKPEQSAPYEPLWVQLGQLPEHEPLAAPSFQPPWPHQ